MVSTVFAQNALTVSGSPVQIPSGGAGNLIINFQFDEADLYAAYSFDVALPEGISVVDTKTYTLGDCHVDHGMTINYKADEKVYSFASLSQNSEVLIGTSGMLVSVPIKADASLTSGTVLNAKIQNIVFGTKRAVYVPVENDVDFEIAITNEWILDENSTAVPAASEGEVNVLVKRTIVANQWSTICLPFEMTKEQVSAVFGDAQFALFDSYEVDGDEPGKTAVTDAQSITINFAKDDMTDGLIANFPYLIKTTENLSEINVEGVVITPDEESADITYETKISGKKYTHGHFYGTLRAGQVIPANDLFLNNNKFYYSTGKTKIKGFRGYFELKDLSSALSSSASVKINVDGEATSIDGLNIQYAVEGVYDLSGRKIQLENGDLNKLQKGVYIIDGKKVTIK